MRYNSYVECRGEVGFPQFLAERVYMREFFKHEGLPSDLCRWQSTVDAMLEGVETQQPIYLMIDQSFVPAGHAQRRPGIHLDGYWVAGLSAHGGDSGRWKSAPTHKPRQSHRPTRRPHHSAGRYNTDWAYADFAEPEGIILASSVTGAKGYVGEFHGPVGDGGDCSHLDLSGMQQMQMCSGTVYAGNVTFLHESVPVEEDCYRTLVRLNVPGWSPERAQ